MINRSLASLGRSLSVRLVLPNAVNRPHMARMAVILASGKYLRPGTQSSGRAQYTTKKPLSQKKALLVGSATLKEVRLLGVSSAVIVTLSPIATNSSFCFVYSFLNPYAFLSAKRTDTAFMARD